VVALVEPELRKRGVQFGKINLSSVVALVKDRASTIPQLADEAMLFYAEHVTLSAPIAAEAREPLKSLKGRLAVIPWERAAINDAIKETVKSSGLKMPQVAMPLRHLVTGRAQTPSIEGELVGPVYAAWCDAAAPSGHRPRADAVDRRGARAARARDRARAHDARLRGEMRAA
jgi:hypothetical protein